MLIICFVLKQVYKASRADADKDRWRMAQGLPPRRPR